MTSASSGDVSRHLRQLFGAGSGVGLGDAQLLDRLAADDRQAAEAAFETILARHGAAVLSACRQVLGDGHAAEDAFQATFLVLMRRAPAIRLRGDGSLGAWLHGVAYRTALKARKGMLRRRARERRAARPEIRESTAALIIERDDLAAALHAEVVRLPGKYRVPVVLCYFEGRTHDEAAAALGWPVGTVRCRLSRGRALLRTRLVRRGLAPAALVAAALEAPSVRAEATAPLLHATRQAAIGGTPSHDIARLADLILSSLAAASRIRAILAASALGLLALAAGLAIALVAGPKPLDGPLPPQAAIADPPQPLDEFKGDPLPLHARARLGTSAFHHGSIVNQAFFTRDGKTLVSCDIKRVVSVWDAATGRLRYQIALAGDLFGPISVSPDGTTLLTTEPNADRRIRLWDIATARERPRPRLAQEDLSSSPTFLPDGKTLVTFGSRYDESGNHKQSVIAFWDLNRPDERPRRVVGSWSDIGLSQFSPDGTRLAGVCLAKDPGPPPQNTGGFPTMPATPQEYALRVVEFPSFRERARVPLPPVEGQEVRTLAFSPDSRHLAAGLSDGTVRVYETDGGREQLPRRSTGLPIVPPQGGPEGFPHREVIDALVYSPDGKILAGGSSLYGITPSPGSLYFWDFPGGVQPRRITGFPAGPTSLSFAPDGRTIATSGTWEPVVRLWHVASASESFPQPGHLMGVSALAVSPTDGTVFTAGYDGTVRHWEIATGRQLAVIARLRAILAMAVSPDGKTLLLGGHFGAPVLWSVPERRELRHFPGEAGGVSVQRVAYAADGRTVAFSGKIWDVATGQPLPDLKSPDEPVDLRGHWNVLYPAVAHLAVTADPEVIRTWDLATGKTIGPAIRTAKIRGDRFAVSADGRFVAMSGYPDSQTMIRPPPDPSIRVWELATARLVATLPAHEASVSGLALSPDGRLLAAFRSEQPTPRKVFEPQPQDPTVRIWDVATGRELRRLEGHRGPVNAAVFTPDGRTLITAGEDATALVWDLSDLGP